MRLGHWSKRKRTLTFFLAGITVYLGSYFLLSAWGSYSKHLYPSGRFRWTESRLGLPDTQVWQPLGLTVTAKKPSGLAIIYYSLIKLDQTYWHPSLSIFDVTNE